MDRRAFLHGLLAGVATIVLPGALSGIAARGPVALVAVTPLPSAISRTAYFWPEFQAILLTYTAGKGDRKGWYQCFIDPVFAGDRSVVMFYDDDAVEALTRLGAL